MITDLKKGIRRNSAIAVVGAAASVLLFQISNYANQVGNKSFKLRKIHVWNAAAGALPFTLGAGAAGAYVAATPAFATVNNMDTLWEEEDLPDVEWAADMYVQAPAWAVGALNIQVEVEECG